jgi:hypothetical protein
MWVCGADEMILSSTDGGTSWETKHQNRDGEVLLSIAFIDEKVGHAAGTGGILLSTVDGGQTWKSTHLSGTVRSFSFGDAENGIAVVSSRVRQPTDGPLHQVQATTSENGLVKITHDGGVHWEDIAALSSDELRPFTEVLSVAALDKSHYLMIRRQPNIEDAFVVSKDGGASWKIVRMQNDATNRVMASTVFAHQAEYWAFGMELVHREKGGGYGVPLTIHSNDGEKWAHGVAGPSEFGTCNSQGCYMWDGAVEVLYGEQEKFWAAPQDGSLTERWAIAENTVCTVGSTLKCASVSATDKPQPRPEAKGIVTINLSGAGFAEGCLECDVEAIVPDNPNLKGRGRVVASIKMRRDGSVESVSVEKAPTKGLRDAIEGQVAKWLFEPAPGGSSASEIHRDVPIDLTCFDWPGRADSLRCTLHPAGELPGPGPVTTASPATQ